MGHFLDSDSTWQVAASSCPVRPASRTRVSRPQAEPQVFPLCVQGLQLPQGLGSHSSVGWREKQTDRQMESAGRECPSDPRAGSEGFSFLAGLSTMQGTQAVPGAEGRHLNRYL